MNRTLDRIRPGLFFVAMLAAWQIACDVFAVPTFLLPTPVEILRKIAEVSDRMVLHSLATLREILIGFGIACVGGVALAAITAHSRLFSRTVFPILVMSQTVPTIAIAPLLVIWFGPGDVSRLIVVFMIAFFPMVVNTAVGLSTAEPEMLDLVRTLRASRWQVFAKIRFPNALPYIFTGLKLNATMSVIGAIVGEFVASERGLGALIITGGVTLETPSIFASLILISALGLVLYGLVVAVEHLVAPWAHREDAAT